MLPGVNVVLNGGRLLIPDLVITTAPGHTGLYFTGDQVLLAAEVHSPSSRTYDRALKSQLYAEGGVQYLLLVEGTTEPPDAVLYGLADGGYRELGRSDDGVLVLRRPFDATLDLNQRR